jgi:hypothetical protein
MRPRHTSSFTALALCVSGALAEVRVEVPDVRSLLVAAIDAADGRAQGILVGPAADAITQRFKGTTPIHLEVSTVRRYVQAGCSRLNLRAWQDGVLLPGALAPRRQTIDIGINYCRDGQPPKALD